MSLALFRNSATCYVRLLNNCSSGNVRERKNTRHINGDQEGRIACSSVKDAYFTCEPTEFRELVNWCAAFVSAGSLGTKTRRPLFTALFFTPSFALDSTQFDGGSVQLKIDGE